MRSRNTTRSSRPDSSQLLFSEERWLPVPESDGFYDVSDHGRIRSYHCVGPYRRRSEKPRILNLCMARGYIKVCIVTTKLKRLLSVHRLVLTAFVRPCGEGEECRHLDGDPSNNRLDNLAWGTPDDQVHDKYRHGTLIRAKKVVDPEPFMFADSFIPIEAIIPWEFWKTVNGYTGYDISNFGRIRSYWNHGSGGLLSVPRILFPNVMDKYGHLRVNLRISNGVYKSKILHRVVIENFSPQDDPILVCRHVNGDASDNSISNLRWGTKAENQRDMVFHGKSARGERSLFSKLTSIQVIEIKKRLKSGEKNKVLSLEFGVNASTIRDISLGRNWRHIKI